MKKFIAILLASFLILTLFTSCAANKNDNGSHNDTGNSEKSDDVKIEITDEHIFYAAFPKNLKDMQFSTIYPFDSKMENAQEVIGICTKDISDIKLYSAEYNSDSEKFTLTKELFTQRKLTSKEAILMKIPVPEGMPNIVISFTDADKKEYQYAVGYNKKDKTVKLEEVKADASAIDSEKAAE